MLRTVYVCMYVFFQTAGTPGWAGAFVFLAMSHPGPCEFSGARCLDQAWMIGRLTDCAAESGSSTFGRIHTVSLKGESQRRSFAEHARLPLDVHGDPAGAGATHYHHYHHRRHPHMQGHIQQPPPWWPPPTAPTPTPPPSALGPAFSRGP